MKHGDVLSSGKEVGGHNVITFKQKHTHQSSQLSRQKFYNSVRLVATLLDRSVSVCGTMRANRCIPIDLEREGRHLKKGQSAFRRKGDIMVQMWEDKRLARTISTIHGSTIANTKERQKSNPGSKRTVLCPVQ